MNILVIGLGSMGKRRIRLIQEIHPDYKVIGVDGREDRRIEVENIYGIECVDSLNTIDSNYDIDCAFVCTSPLSHNSIIKKCLDCKWHVFSEINLVQDGYEENITLSKANKCVLFLSSTFFYREEVKYLRKKIDKNTKWNYVYHIGQYLPDWHPWENYKDFFVGEKKTNGCREIMAIELPWIVHTFGQVKDINVISDKMTELNIDYNDNYMIQLTHLNGNKGTLIIDVVSPVAVRRLEVYAENKYLQWSGTPDSLQEYDKNTDTMMQVPLNEKEEHKDGYREFVVENAYKNEVQEFFAVVKNNNKPIYGFEQDLEILNLIDEMEA